MHRVSDFRIGKFSPLLAVFVPSVVPPTSRWLCCATSGVDRQDPIKGHSFTRIVHESDNFNVLCRICLCLAHISVAFCALLFFESWYRLAVLRNLLLNQNCCFAATAQRLDFFTLTLT